MERREEVEMRRGFEFRKEGASKVEVSDKGVELEGGCALFSPRRRGGRIRLEGRRVLLKRVNAEEEYVRWPERGI